MKRVFTSVAVLALSVVAAGSVSAQAPPGLPTAPIAVTGGFEYVVTNKYLMLRYTQNGRENTGRLLGSVTLNGTDITANPAFGSMLAGATCRATAGLTTCTK